MENDYGIDFLLILGTNFLFWEFLFMVKSKREEISWS